MTGVLAHAIGRPPDLFAGSPLGIGAASFILGFCLSNPTLRRIQ